jgi:hypothetical protein
MLVLMRIGNLIVITRRRWLRNHALRASIAQEKDILHPIRIRNGETVPTVLKPLKFNQEDSLSWVPCQC